MVIPFLGWALTGLVFFIKPGYTEAFEILSIKTYGNQEPFLVPANSNWLEVRMLKSVLGKILFEYACTTKVPALVAPDGDLQGYVGGGGIPAYNDKEGILHGLDGVIDKDYSAALLGRIIRADELFMITDVDNVFLNYKQGNEKKLDKCTVSEAEK